MKSPTPVRLVAHRGWTTRFPENTLSALTGALEVGASWVEVDVQLSSDRVPHLFHDRTLERLTGAEGALHERTAAELRELRAADRSRFGDRFASEPLPTLEAALRSFEAHPRAELFVELKRSSLEVFGPDAVLDAVLPLLGPRTWLISFDLEVLTRARARADLRLGPVLEDWRQLDSRALLELDPQVVFCNEKRLPSEGDLELAQGALVVYEIDQPARARQLVERGATWIETFAVGEMLAGLRAEGTRT